MKKLKKHTLSVLLVAFLCFANSCETEDISLENDQKTLEKELVLDKQSLNGKESSGLSESSYEKSSNCQGLQNDGCNFTSGCDREFPNMYLMVDMMNNCRTESLSSNCSWQSDIQTRILTISLTNCVYPDYAMNARLNNWKQAAINNKPNSSYLITGYECLGGSQNGYGPFEMRLKVTYRKKSCAPLNMDYQPFRPF